MPQRTHLRRSLLSQHPGQLQVHVPRGLPVRTVQRGLPGHQRVWLRAGALQLRLLQHGGRLPVRLSAGLLPDRPRVSAAAPARARGALLLTPGVGGALLLPAS